MLIKILMVISLTCSLFIWYVSLLTQNTEKQLFNTPINQGQR